MAILTLGRVGKHFGSFGVLRGLQLSVVQKQCFGLHGPNGADKTATLRPAQTGGLT